MTAVSISKKSNEVCHLILFYDNLNQQLHFRKQFGFTFTLLKFQICLGQKEKFSKSLTNESQYHLWGICKKLKHTALLTAIQWMIQAYLNYLKCTVSPL